MNLANMIPSPRLLRQPNDSSGRKDRICRGRLWSAEILSFTRQFSALAVIFFTASILPLAICPLQANASDQGRVTFPDSIIEIPTGIQPAPAGLSKASIVRTILSPNEAAATMDFEVGMKIRDLAGLHARVARHEIISSKERVAKYHPLKAQYDAVVSWLKAQGVTITQLDDNHLAIFARGTVSQISKAFQVTFVRVSAGSREYTSAVTAPSVPAALAPAILVITGLQPHLQAHTHFVPSTSGSPLYTPAQILKAYNATGLSVTGANQTIAIVDPALALKSDVVNFWSICGVNQSPDRYQPILAVSGTNPTDVTDVEEATLDVEWSSAIAPGATVLLYASVDLTHNHLDQAYLKIYHDLPNYPELHQVSLSFGGDETSYCPEEKQYDDELFSLFASAGVTIFVSSGDGGSTPGGFGTLYTFKNNTGTEQPEFPASDPNVIAVGGTTLPLNSDGTLSGEEIAWTYSGGGTSQFFQREPWQTGLGVPSGNMRLVPDVACDADPQTNGLLLVTITNQNNQTQTFKTGAQGTSWGAPIWAGFCALINQARANGGQAPLGQLGPQIYPIQSTGFRDIINGNNGDYSAGPGYDECTGLGTPNVTSLLSSLSNAPTITSQPVNQSTGAGGESTFSVTAIGNPYPTYQWQLSTDNGNSWIQLSNGGQYLGVGEQALTVGGVTTAMSGYQYRCVASNNIYSSASNPATLTVQALPPPQLVLPGTPVDTGATSSAPPGVSYVFEVNLSFALNCQMEVYDINTGTTIYSPSSSSFTTFLYYGNNSLLIPYSSLTPGDSFWWQARTMDNLGNISPWSAPLYFTIPGPPPQITAQPAAEKVTAGTAATFNVAASGTGFLIYQWQTSADGGANWSNLSDNASYNGSGTPELTVSATTAAMTGSQFRCVVSDTWNDSATSGAATLTVQAALPQAMVPAFSPPAGTYGGAQSVTINSTTSGASIAYTTDGTTPTESGGTVTNGIPLSNGGSVPISVTTTLNAIAFTPGYTDSTVASSTYTIIPPSQAAAPTFSPVAGTYTSAQSVTINSSPGATIRYTTDGSTPSETNGTLYSSPVSIDGTNTLKAIAFESGYIDSAVNSGTYVINSPEWPGTLLYDTFTSGASGPFLTTSTVTINPGIGIQNLPSAAEWFGLGSSTSSPETYTSGVGITTGPNASASQGVIVYFKAPGAYSQLNVGDSISVTVNFRYNISNPGNLADAIRIGLVNSGSTGSTNNQLTVESGTTNALARNYSGYYAEFDPAQTTINTSSALIYRPVGATTSWVGSTAGSTFLCAQNNLASLPNPGADTYQAEITLDYESANLMQVSFDVFDLTAGDTEVGGYFVTSETPNIVSAFDSLSISGGAAGSLTITAVSIVSSGDDTEPSAAPPSFSPSAGTYTSAQLVTISTTTNGASINYTTDGSTPTETHGTLLPNGGSVSISATTTLNAIAFASGYTDSPVATAAYTINLPVSAAPTFSPASGTFTSSQSVAISSATSGASIAYTTDGTTPAESSGTITNGTFLSNGGSVSISVTNTLNAIAFTPGYTDSTVASGTYTIIPPPQAATPAFNPPAGTYTGTQSLAISSSTGGTLIAYTTDGTTPAESGGSVSNGTLLPNGGSVSIGSSTTIKAIAFESGYTDSAVAAAAYAISVPISIIPQMQGSTGYQQPAQGH